MKNLIQSVLILIAVLISGTSGAEEVVYAQVGDTVTLKCQADSYRYLYWKIDDTVIKDLAWINDLGGKHFITDEAWSNKLSFSGDSLVITNIQEANFGKFFCQMPSGPRLTSIKILQLSVSMTPRSPLLPGESLTLSCSVNTLGNKKPQVHWLNPQDKKENSLVNKRVTSQDTGKWTCVVTDGKNKKETRVSVTVVDLSPAPSDPKYTSKSKTLNIPCSFAPHVSWEHVKARDVQEIYWQFSPDPSSGLVSKDTQKLYFLNLNDSLWKNTGQHRELRPVQNLKNGDLSLSRKQGREEDRGNYVCNMKFKSGAILNRAVRVEVLQIISSPQTDLVSGQPLNLSCSLGHPLPSGLHVKWSPPPGSSLPALKSEHHPADVIIPEVGTGDGGKWECSLLQGKNQLTSAVITLKIGEHRKLSVWMLVIICSAAAIVILIVILVFILCRRRKVQLNHPYISFCETTLNPKPKGFYRT
uniref:CD4-1 molecule n=1 Tax=Seriola lalandi dorsalis TaxID=1841481 RepID=A0A3B4YUG3_SERLL